VSDVRIMAAKTATNAHRFLRDLHRACPIRIAKILTIMEKSSPTGSLPHGRAPRPASTISTSSAPCLASSTA